MMADFEAQNAKIDNVTCEPKTEVAPSNVSLPSTEQALPYEKKSEDKSPTIPEPTEVREHNFADAFSSDSSDDEPIPTTKQPDDSDSDI